MRLAKLALSLSRSLERINEPLAGPLLWVVLYGAALFPTTLIVERGEYAQLLCLALAYVVWGLFSTLAITIHEIGHAVAAWSAGWVVREIVVFRVGFSLTKRRFSRARKHGAASDLGGWMFATPPPGRPSLHGEGLIALGGPLANLATATLALVLAASVLTDTRAAALAGSFSVFSLAIGLANLYPRVTKNGANSDGKSLLERLARHELGVRDDAAHAAVLRALGQMKDGQPVAAADLDIMKTLSANGEGCPLWWGEVFKIAALTSGDLEWVRTVILDAEKSGQSLSSVDAGILALAAACLDSDEQAGSAWLSRVPEAEHDSPYFLRSRAAVDYVGGRRDAALEAIAKLRRVTQKPDWGDRDDHALIHAIENETPLPTFRPAEPSA